MVKVALILSFTFIVPCIASSQKTAKQSGKEWGQKNASTAFDQGKKTDAKDLLSPGLKNQKFDAKNAAWKVEHRVAPQSETLDFLTSQEVQNNQRQKLFHEDELFMKTSEEIFADKGLQQHAAVEEEKGYTLHTCQQAGDPFLVSAERSLNVHVYHAPEEFAKVCLGHEIAVFVKNIGDFYKSIRKIEKEWKENPTIKWFEISCLHVYPESYLASIRYQHVENAEGCDKCETQKIKEDSYHEVGDEWIYDDSGLWNFPQQNPDATIIEHVCVDATPTKVINGKSVSRQCWKERITYLYQLPSTNDCNFLKQKNCEQIQQDCIQFGPSGCIQWQLTFRCFENITRKHVPIIDLEQDSVEETIEYVPNQSFSEVAAKLAVFEEAKKEMEKSQAIDVTKLEIFTGKRMSCSKNIADNVMYDCCFRYSGLAKQIGLSKCNADEIGLAEMREQGLCHYVGSYEEKFLDLWKSRDEHVFCCFPSKLSRIVQEEGRKQLGMDWGKPKEPNCRGFTTKELSSLNFSKIDLSEICEDFVKKLPEDMPDRLQAFQNRLQQDIDQAEVKK